MGDLLRLLILAPFAYVLAILAAALTIALTAVDPVQIELRPAGVALVTGMVVFYAGAATFIPALIGGLLAELFRIRSVFYFVLFGGALGFALHQFAPFFGTVELFDQRALSYPAAGFVGGFVYWLFAGRLAGIGWMRKEAAPSENGS